MFRVPDFAFEFHGHKCPFMPIGYRMGVLAMEILGVPKSPNHEMRVFSEMGIGHPQGCMQDGIMASTGATFGKGMIEKLNYGKVAALFYYPGKGAVRIALRADFVDLLSPHEFFKYRKKGVEPSEIPENVSTDIINIVLKASTDDLFTVKKNPDFKFTPVSSSFNKIKCDVCGEYVFERYIRKADDIHVCIPCSGYGKDEYVIHLPLINK